MDYSINQLEHIYRALKLYIGIWNTVNGVPNSLHISNSEKEDLEKICSNIKNEIQYRKQHE